MSDISILELLRITIPSTEELASGKASKFLDVLANSQDLTESLLYAHQPVSNNIIPIYSTSEKTIGKLDADVVNEQGFNIIDGPAIVVARKGYAGRLFVVRSERFIVHEDAYPIKPKSDYNEKINLDWFALHYNEEFQANRTSAWGIGDFPRTRFMNMKVVIPKIELQNDIADLYLRRKAKIEMIKEFETNVFSQMDEIILNKIDDNLVNNNV